MHDQSKDSEKRYYRVNDIFTVNYRLENLSTEKEAEITVKSTFSPVRHSYLQFVGSGRGTIKDDKITLCPGEIVILRRIYKIIEYREKLLVPELLIKHNGKEIPLKKRYLNCKWLADTPLIGGNYIRACEENIKAFRSSQSISAYVGVICGSSGVGKSRLIREISDGAVAEGYNTFKFNGEYRASKCISWLRACISVICALPELGDEAETVLLSTGRGLRDLAVKILYQKHFDVASHIKECSALLMELAVDAKIALFFDNLQFFDNTTLEIVDSLITHMQLGKESNLKLILGFNTDYLFPKSEAKRLFSRIQLLQNTSLFEMDIYTLDGFSEGQAELYIRQCLLCKNAESRQEFSSVIALLIEKTGSLPIAIEQTLFYLAQRGAIQKSLDHFLVSDLDEFHQIIRNLPPHLKKLLEKRWEIIEENMPQHMLIREYLCVIGILREAKLELLHDYGADFEILDNMADVGLLKQTETDAYIVYHGTLNTFFLSLFKNVRSVYAPKLADTLERGDWINVYPAQYVIAKGPDAVKDELLSFAVDLIINHTSAKELQAELDNVVETALFKIGKRAVDVLTVKAVAIICYHGQVFETYVQAAERYERFLKKFWDYNTYCMEFGEVYADFIREFASLIILLRKEAQCIGLIDDALKKWGRLQFSSEASGMRMRGLLLTRKCAAFKTMNKIEAAIDVAEEVVAISQAIADDELYIRICFDYGYIFFNSSSKIPEVCGHWEKAYDRFERSASPGIEKMLGAVYFHMALVRTMCHQYEEALEFSKVSLNFFYANEKTPYYEIRLYLLHAIISLIYPQANISAKALLDKAEDMCIAYNSAKLYHKCLCLKAKYYYLHGDYNSAEPYLHAGINELYKYINNEEVENKHSELIRDLFIMLRRVSQNGKQFLSMVFNPDLKEQLGSIINMDNEAINLLEEEYESSSCIKDINSSTYFIMP